MIMRKRINFSELLLSQICRIYSDPTEDYDVYFPNFIHQILKCHEDVSHMLDDDQIMEPLCINEDTLDEHVFI